MRLSVTFVAFCLISLAPLSSSAVSSDAVWGRRGMVVSSQEGASRAGLRMLQAGGNAVDAAVATAFAVGVTQPFSAGIGGGGFLLIRTSEGKVVAIDARETAPAAATRDMYVAPGVDKRASIQGPLAVAVPGLVAGLAKALEDYGTLPLARVLEPAIELARDGFLINPYHVRMIERMRQYLPRERFPETVSIQFPDEGIAAAPGWRLVQKDLAKTLETIAKKGPDAFYQGKLAAKMAATVGKAGGLLTVEDLANYRVKLREPVVGSYRGVEVYSYPPPSSGGVILMQILNIIEGFEFAPLDRGSSLAIHRLAEAMKLAFADRAAYLGDPDFIEIPTERLISKDYASEQRARIGDRAITVSGPGIAVDDEGTTHLSVTDADGNAVALTMTINTPYGSGITVAGTGIILNNEMDDFSKATGVGTANAYGLVDTRGANAIAPGKRPLSSMTPTILVKNGEPLMVTGSPGGPRIITATLLTIVNVLDFGLNVQEAVAELRFHHQWQPDKISLEPAVSPDVVEALRGRGHQVEVQSSEWSAAEAIYIDPESGWHLGGSDPRRGGRALGLD